MNEFRTSAVNFYRHSGKAPLTGLFLLGAAGFIGVPILGLIYGYLIYYIPLIYLSILLVFGYAYATGFVLAKAASLGKIRNGLIVGLAGFCFGLLAEYIGWVAWIAAFAQDPTFLIEFFFPMDIARIIIELGKEGVWSFDDTTPTGGALYLIWLVEAIIVVAGTTYFTMNLFAGVPFCEDSDTWADKKSGLAAFGPLVDANQFKSSISQGNFSAFNELKPVQSGNEFTLFELYECETCKNFFVLNIHDVKISVDNKGRQNRKAKPVVSNLIVSPTVLSGLKRIFQEQQTPPQA